MITYKQLTNVNGIESDLATVTCGVPQGSVVRPLLFLLYINDLCHIIEDCDIFLYADDTVLVAKAPIVYDAYVWLQHDLDNLANWCKENKLSINIKKNKSMIVGIRSMVKKHLVTPKLKISGKTINFVHQYKYLGVTIAEILSFNAHLKNTIKLVSHKNVLLHKIRYYIDYGDIFYMNSNSIQINNLQTLQNRALRICYRTRPNVPIDMLHQSSQIPKLGPRRESHLLNLCIKIKQMLRL